MGAPASHQAKAPALAMQAISAPPLIQRRSGPGFVPPVASLAAVPARPAVQRTCEACGEEEREGAIVQPRRRAGSAGTPPEPPADGAASGAPVAVRRTCEACGEEEGHETGVQPRLEVGAAADPLEAEADAIAARVMRMETGAASDAPETVQRACPACASTRDEPKTRRAPGGEAASEGEEQEVEVKARRRPEPGGAETIGASEADLVSGGAALPGATRSFFEARMGRDLSGVRVHEGSAALSLNRSISARAFTYRNHIWLGSGESASPTFTMAHELAHVMQQTAPGPIGPEAMTAGEDGGTSVRRINCDDPKGHNLFFAPNSKKKLAAGHNQWLNEITKRDSSIIGEAPVPNAQGTGLAGPISGCSSLQAGRWGRADLMRTNNGKIVGMGYAENRSAANIPRPWSSPDTVKMGCAAGRLDPVALRFWSKLSVAGKPVTGSHKTHSAPTWTASGYGQDGAGAPSEISIGEVKFGGTPNPRRSASAQINAYLEGLDFVRKGYSNVRDNLIANSNELEEERPKSTPADWTLKTAKMTDWSGPKGWTTLETDLKLVIARWHQNSDGDWEARRCDGTHLYDGKFYGAHDSRVKHVWLYAWYPDAMPPSSNLSGGAKYRGYRGTAAKLMGQLRAPPGASPAAGPAQQRLFPRRIAGTPRPPSRDGAAASPAPKASPARASIRRKTTAKPIPANDPFRDNYEKWKSEREALQKEFKAYSKKDEFGTDIEPLLFGAAVDNTADIIGDNPNNRVKPDTGEKRKDAISDLRVLQIMASPAGGIIGALRYRFGSFFLSVMKGFEKLKAKFADLFTPKPNSKLSGLAGAALKVFTTIISAIARFLLPQITNALIECVQTGVGKKIGGWMAGSPIEELEAKLQSYLDQVKDLKDEVLGQAEDMLKSMFEPVIATYESVKDEIKTIVDIVGLAKKAFNAARAMACLAGGLETVGIACIVSAADALLSLIDASPSELLLASLLGTCAAQQIFAEAMLAVDTVRQLPRKIARKIVESVGGFLPDPVKDMLCAPESMDALPVEVPKISDVTCGAGGSDAGVPQGKDWVVPPGVDKATLDRPPTPAELAQYGKLDLAAAAAAVPGGTSGQPPAQPAGNPPAPTGAGADAGQGDGIDHHAVREDVLTGDSKGVGIEAYIHGIGGGFSVGTYADVERDVKFTAATSSGNQYGPDKIVILMSEVYENPKRKGIYRIKFKAKTNYVLTSKSGKGELGIVTGKTYDYQIGSRM
ncbi:MAG TPA: DUF4157 domain-containing protein [Allosphingosinicella sp.]|jgi:hypothetical protein